MSNFGIPGPGGSLGQCAPFKQAGSDTTFYGHDECLEEFGKPGLTMLDLPTDSPLRQLYERQEIARQSEALQSGGGSK